MTGETHGASAFEQVTRTMLQGVERRIDGLEERFQASQETLNGNLVRLWKAQTEMKEEIKQVFADHAKSDDAAFAQLQNTIFRNAPPWAVMLLTIAGTAIGSMAMIIVSMLRP